MSERAIKDTRMSMPVIMQYTVAASLLQLWKWETCHYLLNPLIRPLLREPPEIRTTFPRISGRPTPCPRSETLLIRKRPFSLRGKLNEKEKNKLILNPVFTECQRFSFPKNSCLVKFSTGWVWPEDAFMKKPPADVIVFLAFKFISLWVGDKTDNLNTFLFSTLHEC